MLNPKYRRYVNRLEQLIEESQHVAVLEYDVRYDFKVLNIVNLNAWLIKVDNIIEMTFGTNSPHFKRLQELKDKNIQSPHDVKGIEGLLTGALDDLKSGFLLGHEFLIAGDIFDSVLEEADHLLTAGHKDAAAVLTRVVLENALRRLAQQEEGLDDAQKASKLNDELKKNGRYGRPQWRLIQAWLDVGNSAAHGEFDEYDDTKVKSAIDGIESFISIEFQSS